ncbi:MAG TPA: type II toxin-antitoxin system RelE/ParE family toxin [Prolixibacteraceae bacterium]
MVKQVIWTKLAHENRKSILEYWTDHNKSNTYSRRLNQLFESTIELISKYPKIGKKTEIADIRIKSIKEYFVTYREKETSVEILAIWDQRQDPDHFKRILPR